jgi:copper resistance protein C
MDILCWRKTVFKFRFALAAPVLFALAFAGSAHAHAKLLSSSPAANATVAKPGKIVLNFNEKLVAAFVKTSLNMTGMPGMADHPLMPITGYTSAMSKDGKTLTLTMRKALPPGTYQLKWSAAGADTHRMEGTFSFTVK